MSEATRKWVGREIFNVGNFSIELYWLCAVVSKNGRKLVPFSDFSKKMVGTCPLGPPHFRRPLNYNDKQSFYGWPIRWQNVPHIYLQNLDMFFRTALCVLRIWVIVQTQGLFEIRGQIKVINLTSQNNTNCCDTAHAQLRINMLSFTHLADLK